MFTFQLQLKTRKHLVILQYLALEKMHFYFKLNLKHHINTGVSSTMGVQWMSEWLDRLVEHTTALK